MLPTRRSILYSSLVVMTIAGTGLLLRALAEIVMGVSVPHWAEALELSAIGVLVTPWATKMPSGASWRPGMPLMMMALFLLPAPLVVLVPLPSVLVITWRSRAKLWKYFESSAHVALGLYGGSLVYAALLSGLGRSLYGMPVAMVCALTVHLLINRSISALIVAHRDGAPVRAQLIKVYQELHWGYLNAYLLILMTSMVAPALYWLSFPLAALIQAGIYLAVSHYTSVESLQKSLRIDGLTDVENRKSWDEWVAAPSLRKPHTTILVIDVDEFKRVNDEYGHLTGDKVLRELARTMRTTVPKHARVFRIGGDEFAAVAYGMSKESLAAQLQQAFSVFTAYWAAQGVASSASVGLAEYPSDGLELSALFALADQRMYEAKRDRKTRLEAAVSCDTTASV